MLHLKLDKEIRITEPECPELKGTHKDHQSAGLSPAHDTPGVTPCA